MDKELKKNKLCGQGFNELDMIEYGCNFADCKSCGHNPRVAAYRRRQVLKYGLTKGKNGLWHYTVIRRSKKNGKHQS